MDDELPQDFRERAFRFTLKLFDYCAELGGIPGPARRLSYQLFDAGGSIGANLAESRGSYSRKELAAKNAISLKESHESKYWLRVAQAKEVGHAGDELLGADARRQVVGRRLHAEAPMRHQDRKIVCSRPGPTDAIARSAPVNSASALR